MDKTIPQTPIQPPLRQMTPVQEHVLQQNSTAGGSSIDITTSTAVTNNSKLIIGGTGLLLILILSIVIVINGNHNRQVLTLPAHQESSTAAIVPTPVVSDTAPAIPMNQKAKLVVHHSDSSYETFLVPVSNEDIFKRSMPPGDTVVQTIPPNQ